MLNLLIPLYKEMYFYYTTTWWPLVTMPVVAFADYAFYA